VKHWLVDTGPFVAYLDGGDPKHDRVSACIDGFAGRFVTTGAVVTEVMYFLADVPDGPGTFAELLVSADVRIAESFHVSQIRAAAARMKTYTDTPMDFADATLVAAAEEHGMFDILTLDRRGFSTYRSSKGRGFRLVLDAHS
jgi:predicted nucleic acid-binding protein